MLGSFCKAMSGAVTWLSINLCWMQGYFANLCLDCQFLSFRIFHKNQRRNWYLNASASIGSQASTMNVQKHHCPSYTVYQMEHRFTFTFQTPISYRKYNFSPFNRLSIRMLFVVKLQISQVGHIRLLTVASNHPRRVFLLKLGFSPRFCFTTWEEF